MTHTRLTLVGLIALTACDPWGNLPNQNWTNLSDELWDADIVAAADGLYVRLPHAGELARVTSDGTAALVDLDGARPTSMVLASDNETVLVPSEWDVCTYESDDIKTLSDCPYEDRDTESELAVIRNGERLSAFELNPSFSQFKFSPDGALGVAFISADEGISVSGALNLTEVALIALETGAVDHVSVGFAATEVLFDEVEWVDSLDRTRIGSRAAVLSQSQVAIVDLTAEPPALSVVFPLTLDYDQEVDPTGAALTADGKYLVIGTVNTADLYVLDLEDENINMVSLDNTPSDLVIDATADQTAIVYADEARVDVMDHDVFDVISIDLDEPCNKIVDTDAGFSVLYNDASGTHDVYRLDYETSDAIEYVLQNPVSSLTVTKSNEYAVALLEPEPGANSSGLAAEYDNNWGLSILDLLDDRSIDFALEAEPIGLEFAGGEQDSDFALLLLDGVESVLQIDLLTTAVSSVDLPEAPTGLGSTPSGRFFITHDSPLGLVSFLDPETGNIDTVSGFAAAGLFTDDTLVRTGDDAE